MSKWTVWANSGVFGPYEANDEQGALRISSMRATMPSTRAFSALVSAVVVIFLSLKRNVVIVVKLRRRRFRGLLRLRFLMRRLRVVFAAHKLN